MSMFPTAVWSDEEEDAAFSPIAPAPAPDPNDEKEAYFRFSLVPSPKSISPIPREGGARRALVFDPSPPRAKRPVTVVAAEPERGRGDRQHFVMREVTSGVGGLEDAYLELRGGGKTTPFVVLKMPELSQLENNQATVTFRPVGSFPPGQEIRFNVARAKAGMFRGYRIELGRARQKDDVFTAGIDNADQTAFPTDLSALGYPQDEIVFSVVRVPSRGGYNEWSLSASDYRNVRMRLVVVLVDPFVAVKIFEFSEN